MKTSPPNILLIVADQLAPHFLSAYGHPITRTPNIDSIAEQAVVFDAAYTNSPLCVPARAGLFSGRLPSRIGVFDSANEFAASVPTVGHYLRRLGFHTCLSGKCHFIGPDQLHGFEDRVTTDICPGEYVWFSHWDEDGERTLDWYHHFGNVKSSGIAERSTQQDHDHAAAYFGTQWLYDWRRDSGRRPFFMQLSFTHPHDPYVTPRRYWDRYEDHEIDMPGVAYIPPEERDAYSAWLYRHYDRSEVQLSDDDIARARRAYYGNISLVDDLVGQALQTLKSMQELERTIIIFVADHGDMLGERGQWYKMSPFEQSSRIPMLVAGPGIDGGRRCDQVVSLVDLLPTIVDLASGDHSISLAGPIEGNSFTQLLHGEEAGWPNRAVCEMMFEGLTEPAVLLRKGAYKYVRCSSTDSLLFNIVEDPRELTDLTGQSHVAGIEEALRNELSELYDFASLREEIVASQTRRRLIVEAFESGKRTSWNHQPFTDSAKQYYRVGKTWHQQEASDFLRFDR